MKRVASINQLIQMYERYALDYYRKPKTRRPTGEHVQIHYAVQPLLAVKLPEWLRPLPECTQLADMDPDLMRAEHLDEVRKHMVTAGLCLNTINDRISRVRRMFKWAAQPPQRMISSTVVADLALLPPLEPGRTDAPVTEDIEPVEWDVVAATMAAVSLQAATMIEVAWLTGMRPCELCSMRKSTLRMPADGPWVYQVEDDHNKNAHHGQARTIFFGPEARMILRQWIRRLPPGQDHLWQMKVKSFWTTINRACKRKGIPHWHPNQLRHSCGRRLAETQNLEAARVVLGHAKITTTEIYAKYARRDQLQAAEIMQKMG